MTGALALLVNGKLIEAVDMPVFTIKKGKRITHEINAAGVRDTLKEFAVNALDEHPFVVLEKVHSMPKQGVASSFAFGRSLGVIEGVVAALGMPLVWAVPNVWKREMKLTGKGKGASRQMATNLWPDCADLFKLVKHDGRAEAALMAEWGRQG